MRFFWKIHTVPCMFFFPSSSVFVSLLLSIVCKSHCEYKYDHCLFVLLFFFFGSRIFILLGAIHSRVLLHGSSAVYAASHCSHIKTTIGIVKHHWFHIKIFLIFFNEQLQIYLVDFFHLYSLLFWWTASCFCVYKFIQWNKNITHIFLARTNDCCSIYNLIPIVSDDLIELERWGKVNQSVRYVNNSNISSVSNVFHFQLSVLSIWAEDVFFSSLLHRAYFWYWIQFSFAYTRTDTNPEVW